MISSLTQAHSAYAQSLQNSQTSEGIDDGFSDGPSKAGFGSILSDTLAQTIHSGHAAEAQSAQGLMGHGDVTKIVTAVSNAQLALQTTTVLRDRMVQAYQDVMRMAI